ncbi:MAG TPA: hypothetical protein VGO55_17065 [Allosphingosinicella sp.]|nr:hypothetical protein [Allosphingosinicella sp.]
MWTLILGAALALAEPATHPGVADPVAFMRARYSEYLSGNVRVLALDTYASERLRARLYAFDEAAGGQEVDSLDFWVGEPGDWSLAGLSLTLEPPRHPGRQTVTARFRNAGRPMVLHFRFVRERGAWYLDEVVRPGRRGWTLSGRLAMRP